MIKIILKYTSLLKKRLKVQNINSTLLIIFFYVIIIFYDCNVFEFFSFRIQLLSYPNYLFY